MRPTIPPMVPINLQNPTSIKDPEDFPLVWNAILPLAVQIQKVLYAAEDKEDEDIVAEGMSRFYSWVKEAPAEEIKRVLTDYLDGSIMDLNWEGHEDLSGNSLLPVYDILARDIMMFKDYEESIES